MSNFPTQHPNTNPMFSFEGKDVRVILRDGQPWFVAVDVARALQLYLKGGNSVNTASMVRTLGKDEQEYVAPKNIGGIVDNRVGMFLTVSESGLYKIIMRASPNKNDRVKKFQDWVTRDVLPALRKDGMYVMGEEKVKTEGPVQKVQGLVCCSSRNISPAGPSASRGGRWMYPWVSNL